MSGSPAAPRQSSAPEAALRDPFQAMERRLSAVGDAHEDVLIKEYVSKLKTRGVPPERLAAITAQMEAVFQKYQLEARQVTADSQAQISALRSELDTIVQPTPVSPLQKAWETTPELSKVQAVEAILVRTEKSGWTPKDRTELALMLRSVAASDQLVKLSAVQSALVVAELYMAALAASEKNAALLPWLDHIRKSYPTVKKWPKRANRWWESTRPQEELISSIQLAKDTQKRYQEEEKKDREKRFLEKVAKDYLGSSQRLFTAEVREQFKQISASSLIDFCDNHTLTPQVRAELLIILKGRESDAFKSLYLVLIEGFRSIRQEIDAANNPSQLAQKLIAHKQNPHVWDAFTDDLLRSSGDLLGRVVRAGSSTVTGNYGYENWEIGIRIKHEDGVFRYDSVQDVELHLKTRDTREINGYYFANYLDYCIDAKKQPLSRELLQMTLWGMWTGYRRAIDIAGYWWIDLATGQFNLSTESKQSTVGQDELSAERRQKLGVILQDIVKEQIRLPHAEAGRRIYQTLMEINGDKKLPPEYTPEWFAKKYAEVHNDGAAAYSYFRGVILKINPKANLWECFERFRSIRVDAAETQVSVAKATIRQQSSATKRAPWEIGQIVTAPRSTESARQKLAEAESVLKDEAAISGSPTALRLTEQLFSNPQQSITSDQYTLAVKLGQGESDLMRSSILVANTHASDPNYSQLQSQLAAARQKIETVASAIEKQFGSIGTGVNFVASDYISAVSKSIPSAAPIERIGSTPVQTELVRTLSDSLSSSSSVSNSLSSLTPSIRYDVPSASGVTIERSGTGDGATVRFGEREVFCASPEQVSHTIQYGRYMEDLGLSMMAGDFHRALADSGIPFDIRDGIDDAKKRLILKIIGMRFWWKGGGVKELWGSEFVIPPDGNVATMESSIRQYASLGGQLDISSRALALGLLRPGEASISYEWLKRLVASMVSALQLAR